MEEELELQPELQVELEIEKILSVRDWTCERYPNTVRQIWIYVPANVTAGTRDLGLIQFNDGRIYLDKDGQANVQLTNDATRRVCCGASSGGIAAFTCAWHFPDRFVRVLSHVGSFTNIKGGHNYPWLIRSTPRKPIRVFLQSGENDAATLFGDWPLAIKTMANALQYAGYDYRFEFGTGGHSIRHGGALFADSIRWLLR